MSTVKTAVGMEFTSRMHRDRFLRDFQALLFQWGNKAPKVKLRLTLETECEFGDPSSIDLFSMGVADPDAPQSLTPIEQELQRLAGISPTAAAAVHADILTAMRAAVEANPPPEPEPAPEPTLGEIVLQTLAARGPLTLETLAQFTNQPTFALTVELERLHEAGDVEPDDGERWRLVDREAE